MRFGCRPSGLRGYAQYNLAFHLHAAGETDRAEAELAGHEELIHGASPQLANLLVWLRARIAWSRGELELLEAAARRDALTRELLEQAVAALEGARHVPRTVAP